MLTPLEMFYLMGFDKKDYEKCKALKISDTQLYKMTGNSITVPILEEIYNKLLK
jgi:DNA (cytosine-5)-methyltransferase 1